MLCAALCLGATGERPVSVAAGGNGEIRGHARDASGRALHGVSVTVIPERGGPVSRAMTDAGGAYRLEGLPDGAYRVDFDLLGFDRTRRNHVRPRVKAAEDIDATLTIGPICECIATGLSPTARPVAGMVVDEANRPLPHARVELVSPVRRETAYTDVDGRFTVRTPVEGEWPIAASDTGFSTVTQQISKRTGGPLVLRLRFVGTARVAPIESFALGCLCPEYIAAPTVGPRGEGRGARTPPIGRLEFTYNATSGSRTSEPPVR